MTPDKRTDNAILGALRRCWSRSLKRREVLEKAKHPTAKGPRGGTRYTCAECGKTFSNSNLNVDHVDPVVPLDKRRVDMSWDEIIARMFYSDEDNLQVLCRDCHDKKSKAENKERRRLKNGKH